MEYEGKSPASRVNVVFVSGARIRALNKKFHNKDASTDVLAFDLGEAWDIVVSVDAARAQAKIFHTSVKYELLLYTVHGLLHFLGYNDRTEKQRMTMQKHAERILTYVNP